jgi:hypothetical protein
MKKTNLFLFIAIASLFNRVEADYFPVQIGNKWEFALKEGYQSGDFAPHISYDSGAVYWQIVRIQELDTIPIQRNIYIEESRAFFCHRSGGLGGTTVDSVYNPVIFTKDTLILHEIEGGNGMWFDTNSWAFVHDPNGDTAGAKIKLSAVTISYKGEALQNATEIDQIEPIKMKSGYDVMPDEIIYQEGFTIGNGIGPVSFYKDGPCISGTCYYGLGSAAGESWVLINADIKPSSVIKQRGNRNNFVSNISYSNTTRRLMFSLEEEQHVSINAYLINGRFIKKILPETFLKSGNHSVVVKNCGENMAVLNIKSKNANEFIRINSVNTQ